MDLTVTCTTTGVTCTLEVDTNATAADLLSSAVQALHRNAVPSHYTLRLVSTDTLLRSTDALSDLALETGSGVDLVYVGVAVKAPMEYGVRAEHTAMSPCGRFLACCEHTYSQVELFLFDVEKGERVWRVSAVAYTLGGIGYSRCGGFVVWSRHDGAAVVDAASGRTVATCLHQNDVRAAAFVSSSQIAIASVNGVVLFDFENETEQVLTTTPAYNVLSTSEHILSVHKEKTVCWENSSEPSEVYSFPSAGWFAALDGEGAVYVCEKRALKRYSLRDGECSQTLPLPFQPPEVVIAGPPRCLAVSRLGLLLCSFMGHHIAYDVSGTPHAAEAPFLEHITSLAFTPCGRWLFAGGGTGRTIKVYAADSSRVYCETAPSV